MAEKGVVRTEKAPAPFQGAPYSQAITVGGLVFIAGQLPISPDSGEVVGDTIQEQTEQVFKNLKAILEAAGSGLEQLVNTTVFLTDLGDFGGMNEVYARHIGSAPPARSTVEIAALPSSVKLEIEAIGAL